MRASCYVSQQAERGYYNMMGAVVWRVLAER